MVFIKYSGINYYEKKQQLRAEHLNIKVFYLIGNTFNIFLNIYIYIYKGIVFNFLFLKALAIP